MNYSMKELKDLNVNGIGAMFPNNLQTAADEVENLWDRIVDEYNTTVSNVFYLQGAIDNLYLDDLYQYQVLTFAKDFSPTSHVVDGLTVKNDGTVYDEYAARYLLEREVNEIVNDVVKVMDSRKIFSFASTFEYDPKGKEQFSLLSDTGYCLMFGDNMDAAKIEQGIKNELNKAYNVSNGAIILDWDRTLG